MAGSARAFAPGGRRAPEKRRARDAGLAASARRSTSAPSKAAPHARDSSPSPFSPRAEPPSISPEKRRRHHLHGRRRAPDNPVNPAPLSFSNRLAVASRSSPARSAPRSTSPRRESRHLPPRFTGKVCLHATASLVAVEP